MFFENIPDRANHLGSWFNYFRKKPIKLNFQFHVRKIWRETRECERRAARFFRTWQKPRTHYPCRAAHLLSSTVCIHEGLAVWRGTPWRQSGEAHLAGSLARHTSPAIWRGTQLSLAVWRGTTCPQRRTPRYQFQIQFLNWFRKTMARSERMRARNGILLGCGKR